PHGAVRLPRHLRGPARAFGAQLPDHRLLVAPPAAVAARAPSTESLFVATFTLLGLRLGLRRLGDNSLFLHLRTGIDMISSGSIPRTDPYSFTAAGRPWVVQSWLPEATYGVAHRIGGFTGVRLLHGLVYGLLAWLIGRRSRTGSAVRTALAMALVVGVGIVYWSPRPLAFGLLAFAATVTLVEERLPPWLLVPLVWIWVNSHGSFLLGAAWLVLVAVGQWLDSRGARLRTVPVLPWLGWFTAGLVVSVINPLGLRLLTFPGTVLEKREAFRHVVEWRPLDLQTPTAVVTVTCLAGAVVVLVWGRKALGWRDLLPVAALVLAGLLAQRNLPVAAIALAPVLGRALQAPAQAASAAASGQNRRLNLVLAALLGTLALLFTAAARPEPALALEGYPVRALRLAGEHTSLRRLVTDDVAAGYVILVHGTGAGVFIDDRVDFYPVAVTLDYLRLSGGHPASLDILDHHRAEVVIWEQRLPLVRRLEVSPAWRAVGTRDGWAVFVRAAAAPGP
ncbi:MAG: hypothetical protein KY454_10900, partial [Actinobacteria bacterium]|nr:hypothetical protein [Actinomycetota bacterium]MBW3650760.1 hypothetical protein [Actinomycetota bacterium]